MRASWSCTLTVCLSLPAFGQATVRVSTGPTNFQGNSHSFLASISGDGRYVAFQSMASNLMLNDLNFHLPDIFIKDVQTGAIVLASADSAGVQANNGSLLPSLSTDGTHVAFESEASNLVAADTNLARDVFVRELATGAMTRASVGAGGAQSNGPSFAAALSADGAWVAFESDATNLVAGDTNGVRDVFVHALATGTTQRVSLGAGGVEPTAECAGAAISGDGRFVAFSTAASLVPVDANGASDVYVWERATGALTLASVGAGGVLGDAASTGASLSFDGRYVAFESDATNLVANDGNLLADVFVRDLATGTTLLASAGLSGAADGASALGGRAQLSPDGRFLAFESWASNLVAGDTNLALDVFVRDVWAATNVRVSVTSAGAQVAGGGRTVCVSADGRYAAFESSASNLVAGDNNLAFDVFRRDRGAAGTSQPFCFGDGADASHASACPCGNFGSGGRGCASSVNPAGAALVATGTAAADDVVLHASGMPATSTCVYLQGDALDDAVFGDGVRCAGGNLLRLRVRGNSAGASAFPDATDTVTLSARGGVTIGSGVVRLYQTYYRNAAAAFCPPDTFNVTNGWSVTW